MTAGKQPSPVDWKIFLLELLLLSEQFYVSSCFIKGNRTRWERKVLPQLKQEAPYRFNSELAWILLASTVTSPSIEASE